MTSVAQWDDLLAGEELAYLTTEPPRAARTAELPDALHPKLREALARQGIEQLYAHQAESVRGCARRPPRDRHDRNGVREDAGLQPAGARRARRRPEKPGDLPLSDEGARAGPGARARRARSPARPARDLRRRHATGAPLADPQVGQPDPDQPGHAPHRRAAPPRPLGGRAPQPPLRRRRRGARLSRRVRLARRQRPPAAAPARADLRRRSAVRPRLRDGREPGRARALAARRGRRR